MRLLAALALVLALAAPAFALNPSEVLPDPALEARARAVSSELRCLVCQNQSIEDSDADLAKQLRIIVRERISAGDTDAEARQYVVDRYGEFVLLRPVFAWHTLILWIAAPVLLVTGVAAIAVALLRRRRAGADGGTGAAPTPEEEAALARLQAAEPPQSGASITES